MPSGCSGFLQHYRKRVHQANSLVCVGIDPQWDRLPAFLKVRRTGLEDFCREIIDATAESVCAYKFQIAYFSSVGAEETAKTLIAYIHEAYPDIPVILDSKRGDIGATATQYAKEAFERYQADAVTVNPYMGGDSLMPFLSYGDKGVFILCRTSNPGGVDFQELDIGHHQKLYERVAQKAATEWNQQKNAMLVMGATFPEAMKKIREQVGDDMLFLVPGIGAQGGDIQAVVEAGSNQNGDGLIINVSRSVLYASEGEDFAQAAKQSLLDTVNAVNRYRVKSHG